MSNISAAKTRNDVPSGTSIVSNLARKLILALGSIGVMLITWLLCVPVILLPFTTSVPAWVWIPLAVADMVLVVLQFRFALVSFGTPGTIAGVIFVGLLAVIASQLFASTPPIADASGRTMPGSIAMLEKVELNGSQQWVSIRGKDVNKPILLFLAGGPGGSDLASARRALATLEDHFVVVNWEQPGAGKSFDAVDRSALSPERYIRDGLALVSYLRERFDEDKVYVLGESWGSALGIWMVQREPQAFHAFIGTGQMVAFLETDLMCYEFSMKLAQERGDVEKIEKLIQQGPPPYYGEGVAMKQAAYVLDTFNYMNDNPAIADDGFNTFDSLASPEYGLYDKANWFRGVLDTLGIVYPQLWDVDFREQVTQLEVPVYFLLGRHDVNAPPTLAEEYYELLNASHKELIWFEHSGHNPWVSESVRFVEVIVDIVLPQTYPAGNR